MNYLHPGQRGNTISETRHNKLINMIMLNIILWVIRCFSFSFTWDTPSDWLAVFQSEGDVWAVSPPARLLYKHEVWWHLSWNLQSCRTVSYWTPQCLQLYYFFSFCLSIPRYVGSSLPSAFSSACALMLDMPVHGLYLVTGGKVSWLALQLSSVLQQLKWTCSESSLKKLLLTQ